MNLFGLDNFFFFSQWNYWVHCQGESSWDRKLHEIQIISLQKISRHFYLSKLLLYDELKWLWHTILTKPSRIFILHLSSVLDSGRENENNALFSLFMVRAVHVSICNLQYYQDSAVHRSAFLSSFLIIATKDLLVRIWMDCFTFLLPFNERNYVFIYICINA